MQEYYILDEEHRYTKFYQRNALGKYVEIAPDKEGVIRSAVLPGLQFRTRDMLLKPSLETLAKDAVYQGYVLLHYQQAMAAVEGAQRRVELERQRAELERQRANAEQQRAETLANELEQAMAAIARLRGEHKE